jgi:hypothetical protein
MSKKKDFFILQFKECIVKLLKLGDVTSEREDVNFLEISTVKLKIHVPYFFDFGLNSGNF